jgi:hypothetical protein
MKTEIIYVNLLTRLYKYAPRETFKLRIMTTYKFPLKKIIGIILSFIFSWIGIMSIITVTTLLVKVIGIYVSFIWNLWL